MKRLSDIGEDTLITRLLGQLSNGAGSGSKIIVGPGDDCAVVDVGLSDRYQLLKTDSLVEGVHYLPDTSAARVGWKAIARVVSDFAAMGGWAGELLVTIAMPADKEVLYLEQLYQGMQKCASDYGATICGGETSSVPLGSAAMISIAGTGWVKRDRQIERGGGQVGDSVLVTGLLGGSIHGKHLDFSPRLDQARWLADHYEIHAMMDLSDGLGQDLPRLAAASGCSSLLDEAKIPRNDGCDVSHALGDGEDYELLFTVSPEIVDDLCDEWGSAFPDLPITVVGKLTDLSDSDPTRGSVSGWQHFSS